MNYVLKSEMTNDIIADAFRNRGFTTRQQMDQYFNPSLSDCYDAEKLANIELAAKRLLTALVRQEDIFIQVDCDCDGYTSAALLINYLHDIFPASVENHIVYSLHDDKTHGIDVEAIPENISLIIVPDASSNEINTHKQCKASGIDIIILDHHHAELAEDPAIIVNNQMCDYPNKTLSGVGIVYKFCQILDKMLKKNIADNYLDLVAVGMIADMMDIRNPETHYLITSGLEEPANIFLTHMIEKNSYSIKSLNPTAISFYIAPFINAMTRSGTLEEKQLLFDAMLDYKAEKLVPSNKRGAKGQEALLVDEAVRVATNVKARQERNKKEVLEQIEELIPESDLGSIIVITLDNPIDTNLTGLIANQIMGTYNKPTLILNKKENSWEGSGRGFATQDVNDWRKFLISNFDIMYAEGHAFAFGIGVSADKLNSFKKDLSNYFIGKDITPIINADAIWNAEDDYDHNVQMLALCADYWGPSMPEPNVVIEDISLDNVRIDYLKSDTVKITVPGHTTEYIKFFAKDLQEALDAAIDNNTISSYLTIVGKCMINDYNGNA